MIEIIKHAIDLSRKKIPFIMASIIFKHGSAPREIGATMIVTENGYYAGTIGGGQPEFDAINYAKELLKSKKNDEKFYEVSKEIAAENGMVCGGQSIVHFQYVDAGNDKNLLYFEELIKNIERKNVYLIYNIDNYDENYGISIQVGDIVYPFSKFEPKEYNLFKIKIKKPMKVRLLTK